MRGHAILVSCLVCSLAACGDGSPAPDASVDSRRDTGLSTPADAAVDAPTGRDTAIGPDTGAGLDAPQIDSPRTDTPLDTPATDARPDGWATDGGVADALGPDAYDPGPATPIVVNSGNTASYSLANGQWTRFRFPAEAGQLYVIAELAGVTTGYLDADPAVSPTHFSQKTNAAGVLVFTAPATQTYYLAVAATGGIASGFFQVADGGKPVALGTSTLVLTAPRQDDTTFFRFPVTAGKAYRLALTGTAPSGVGLSLSPKAERAVGNGQFAAPLSSTSGPLPMTETIPAASVALSTTGYYYFFLHVYEPMTLTLALTETTP